MSDFDWGEGGRGAAGGAMSGAAIGSVAGPWGAAIGGVVGGGIGLMSGFGGESEQDKFKKLLAQLQAGYQNRRAPQMGSAAQAQQSSLVSNRAALIAQLEAQARGEGPSAARLQMKDAADRAVRAMAAQAQGAGGRGVNAGAALRNATNMGSATMMQNNRDMGVMRAQEQANAIGQLGQNIGYGINADQQLSQFNAGQQNDRAALNAQLQMQMLGLNTQSQLQALMMASGMQAPGLGTQVMAGGAQAAPLIMQMGQQWRQQNQQGYGGAIGPQPGDPGYAQSSMGQYEAQQRAQQQAAYMASLPNGTPVTQPGQGGPSITDDPNIPKRY